MNTTLLKYWLKGLLLAYCVINTINMQAQLTFQTENGNYSTQLCPNGIGGIAICAIDFYVEEDTEGFLVRVNCNEQSEVFGIPIEDATIADLDEDGHIDDVEIGLAETSAMRITSAFASADTACDIEITTITPNSIALIDDEVPPLSITNSFEEIPTGEFPFNEPSVNTPRSTTFDLSTWLSNQQFYLVKPLFNNAAIGSATCNAGSPEGNEIVFQNCSSNDVTFLALTPITITNWRENENNWYIKNPKGIYDDGTGCASSEAIYGVNTVGATIEFSVWNEYLINRLSIDFTLSNPGPFEFITNTSSPCSGKGKFVNVPLNIPLKINPKNLSGANKTKSEVAEADELQVFPNPCIDELNVNFEFNYQKDKMEENQIEIKIYSNNGSLVATFEQNMLGNKYYQKINAANWKDGIYYCASYKNGVLLAVAPFFKIK